MENKELILIVAISENGVIGNKGHVPSWNAPGDMRRFKQLTLDHPVIMGHTTFSSLKEPLEDRANIVLTRSQDLLRKSNGQVTFFSDLNQAIAYSFAMNPEIYVIGGAKIYNQTINHPATTRLEITRVKGIYEGDTFFPEIDPSRWQIVKSIPLPTHTYETYERKKI